jgi:hypothetical protein
MAQITNAKIRGPSSVDGNEGIWEFIINYTASFSSNELNQEFEDAARIWEKDDTDNDRITPYQRPQLFIANGSAVDRELSIIVFREWVSSELGNEEVIGQIWLRRKGDGLATDERFTGNHVRSFA